MEATIAICTYNRSAYLPECVRSVFAQEVGFLYEVMVIDNNSTDDTRQVVDGLRNDYPDLRYVLEQKQGLSHARNRALEESSAAVVVYIDDDAVAQPGWLGGLVERCRLGADAAGGKIVPIWREAAPWYVSDALYVFFSQYDLGGGVIEQPAVLPHGGNFCVRVESARLAGGFNVAYGLSGESDTKNVLLGEETEFFQRVIANGGRVVYDGRSVIKHYTSRERSTLRGLASRCRQTGNTAARLLDTQEALTQHTDGWVWCTASAISCLSRLHLRDALAFYLHGVVSKSVLVGLQHSGGMAPRGLMRAFRQASPGTRRGVLGLARRTLFGRVPSANGAGCGGADG